MATPITEGNQPSDRELLIELHRKVDRLLAVWQENEHIVAAFRRGGVFAARTAAKRGGHGGTRVQ